MCKRYFLLLFIVAAPGLMFAQKKANTGVQPKLEDLPRRPIDTLATVDENVKVVIFTNNTWEYYYPNTTADLDKSIYREHWDTTQVFAYKSIALADLPQTIELELVKELREFRAPIVGRVLSKYGPRKRRNHNGVDIPLKTGEPIYATFCGRVRYSKYNSGGFGNLVIIRHENGLETWYAHLSRRNVKAGDYVTAGAVIGFGGNTGRSSGAHLHYEVRYCDQTFDPERLIDFTTGDLRYMTFALDKSYFSIYSRESDKLEEEDFEGKVLASDNGNITSEEILNNIETANKAAIAKPKAPDPLYHTIKSGENLGKIASRYGTSIRRLKELNGISDPDKIRAGQRIRVR